MILARRRYRPAPAPYGIINVYARWWEVTHTIQDQGHVSLRKSAIKNRSSTEICQNSGQSLYQANFHGFLNISRQNRINHISTDDDLEQLLLLLSADCQFYHTW